MEFLSNALSALPEVASHPLAFLGYLVVVGIWWLSTSRTARLNGILKRIRDIPEGDRKSLIQLEMGAILPAEVNAQDWLLDRKRKFILAGYVVTVVALLFLFATASMRGNADLIIDDVVVPKISDIKLSSIAYAAGPDSTRASLRKLGVRDDDYLFPFEIVLRNPTGKPVNVTDVRITFDPGTGGALANVQEITGVYVTRVDDSGTAVTSGPTGRFKAYAWYPSGGGILYVKTPISQTIAPYGTDRFQIHVAFPRDYEFLGPMKTAELQVYWNGEEYVRSGIIELK